MFGPFVQDYELEPLRRILNLEIANYPSDSQDALYKLANIVFQRWKEQNATKDGYAVPNTFAALLGRQYPVSDEAFAKALPWECAGLGVRCRTELAFKLWVEDYEPFKQVLDAAGLGRLFAVLALREDPVQAGVMIRVAGVLMDMHLWTFARHFDQASKREQKKLAALAEGRKKGASAQKAKSEERIRGMREFARSYFMQNPTATYDSAVNVLLGKPYSLKSNGERYSPRRILEIISGVRDEALKALGSASRS